MDAIIREQLYDNCKNLLVKGKSLIIEGGTVTTYELIKK